MTLPRLFIILRAVLRLGLFSWVGLWASGCAGNYSEKSEVVRGFYQTGQVDLALEELEKLSKRKQDADLTGLEKGNVLLAYGRPEESEEVFGSVIEPYIRIEDNKPVIDLEGLGGNLTASTVGDDRSIAYRVPGHEMVMAMSYRAMAFLFMGRMESAMVEVRRAAQIQESILDAYRQELDDAPEEEEKQTAMNDKVMELIARMDSVLSGSPGSWNNAYVWWLSGVLREAYGEPTVAQIDYQRAFEINRDHPLFQADLIRLLQANDPGRLRDLLVEFPDLAEVVENLPRNTSSIVVVYEESLVPMMKADTFRMIWPGLHTINLTVPVYLHGRYLPSAIQVSTHGESRDLREGASVQSLAYHRLKENMTAVVWRNISRNIARAVANKSSEEVGGWLEIGMKVATTVKGLAEEADTRSWSTLPMVVQVGRIWVEPGETEVVLASRLGELGPLSVPVSPGGTTLIYVKDTGGYASHYITELQPGAVAMFSPGESLIGYKVPLPLPAVAAEGETETPPDVTTYQQVTLTPEEEGQPAPRSNGSHSESFGGEGKKIHTESPSHGTHFDKDESPKDPSPPSSEKKRRRPATGVF